MKSLNSLTIGIDAANLRRGGGMTHLVEFLRAADPEIFGIDKVIVWGGQNTLMALDDRPWLDKRTPPLLNRGLIYRTLWQRYELSELAREARCDVLFVPGGSYAGNFHPVVTMSRNMLPFELHELKRYGWSLLTVKLFLLRFIQSYSYRNADGLIFLTNYAREVVLEVAGKLQTKCKTIPHGLNPRFNFAPKRQRAITNFNDKNPYRVIYVSTIDLYKHQWHVVEAIAALRNEGIPIVLELIGPFYAPALKRLKQVINSLGSDHSWVSYLGAVPFQELQNYYKGADLAVYASSCENMPNILLETMSSGLPIACSNRGPMPEVLGDGGIYFDPENPSDITNALRKLVFSPELRSEVAKISYQKSKEYSWESCASKTLEFLMEFI